MVKYVLTPFVLVVTFLALVACFLYTYKDLKKGPEFVLVDENPADQTTITLSNGTTWKFAPDTVAVKIYFNDKQPKE